MDTRFSERSTQAATILETTTRAVRAERAAPYRSLRRGAAMLTLVASLLAARPVAADPPHGNAVTHWNAVAAAAFEPTQGTNPLSQSRTLAILHAAIHDVLNAIDRRFEPYTPGLAAARPRTPRSPRRPERC